MAKKKVDDVIANFFGDDDMDWLDGDSEEIPKAERGAPEASPVPLADAPLAPDVSLDAMDEDQTMESAPRESEDEPGEVTQPTARTKEDTGEVTQPIEASEGGAEMGAEEEVAPEPPMGIELPEDPGVFDELQPAPLTPEVLISISDVDPPTLEVDPTSEEVPKGAEYEDDAPEEAAAAEEVAAAEPSEATETLVDDTEVAPRPEPVPVLKWEPSTDVEQWREVAVSLIAEAAVDEKQRGELLLRAAGIYRRRLEDLEGARTLLADALAAGLDSASLHDLRRKVGESLGDAALALDGATRHAAHLEGERAADAWLLAARLAGDDVEGAIAALGEATEADPDSYEAHEELAMLLRGRDEHREQLQFVLGRLAELSAGPSAAVAHHERAQLLEALGRDVDAQGAYLAARAVLPSHMPSLIGLATMLQRLGRHADLAELYKAEATREEQLARGYWLLQAARAMAAAGQEDDADDLYRDAVSAGSVQAGREHVAWLGTVNRPDALVSALRVQVKSSDEGARPFAVYQLARALEQAGENDAALDAFREVATLDAEARPASAAVERVLRAKGDSEALRAFWKKQIDGGAGVQAQLGLYYRIGEQAESVGDQDGARAAMEAVLELDAGFLLAIEALQRVYNRQGAWAELAAIHDRRASLTTDREERATYLHRSGMVHELRLEDLDAAQARYEEALRVVPDYPPSLDALLALLERKEDWSGLSMRLFKAGQAASHEPNKISLLYRAARVLVDRVDNAKKATAILRQVLELAPDFAPAKALLADLAGGQSAEELAQQASESTGRVREWLLLAAADQAMASGEPPEAYIQALLDRQANHPAALAELERVVATSGDVGPLIAAYERALETAESEDESARFGEALAGLLMRTGQADRVAGVLSRLATEAASQPMAVLAGSLGQTHTAFALLAGLDEPPEVLARTFFQIEIDPEGAQRDLESLYAGAHAGLAAELVLRTAEGPARLKALQVLALEDGAVATAARARLLREMDDVGLDEVRTLLAAQPSARGPFERLLADHVAVGDSEAVKALFAAHRPSDTAGLADALEEAGHPAAAADALAESSDLASLLTIERLRTAAADWPAVLEALDAASGAASDPGVLAGILARKRWVLAEHMAGTDAAWDAYRALHESNPDDRDVTRALARIAGQRGEAALGIQYLRELASSSTDSEESAAYQREIAGIHEHAGNLGEARQAYLDALDHVRDDTEALGGLRRLAEAEEDWVALAQVLQRESAVAGAERKVEVLRELAVLTDEKLDDQALAVERWRDVLEASPTDRDALERTVALSEANSDWALFVDAGARLAEHLKDDARAALLRRVGIACEEHLGNKDAERFFTAALEAAPDPEAARRLEMLRRKFGDWSGAVQMLITQAEAAGTDEEKVQHLSEAARIESEQRHDGAAASAIHGRILDIAPDHRASLLYQSEYLFAEDRAAEVLPIYERLEGAFDEDEVDFDDFDVRLEVSGYFYRYAELLRAAERLDEAVTRYQRALDLNPSHLPSLEAVGPLYMQRAEHKQGQAVWRQLVQLTGGRGDKDKVAYYYTQLGLVENALGNHEKASKRFSKALDLNPAHVGALKGMAVLLEAKEDWNNLLNFYNNIIYHATEPADVVSAYLTKGRILDECLDRRDKAAQHYERLLAFDASQSVALLRLGEIRAREESWEAAAGHAAKGLRVERDPTPLRATLSLLHACALHAQGMVTEAEDAWATAAEVDAGSVEGIELGAADGLLMRVRERLGTT